jgi:hypothetical protein
VRNSVPGSRFSCATERGFFIEWFKEYPDRPVKRELYWIARTLRVIDQQRRARGAHRHQWVSNAPRPLPPHIKSSTVVLIVIRVPLITPTIVVRL